MVRSVVLQHGEGENGTRPWGSLERKAHIWGGIQKCHWSRVFCFSLLWETRKANFSFSDKQVAISRFCSETVSSPASSAPQPSPSHAEVSPSLSGPAAAALPKLALNLPSYASLCSIFSVNRLLQFYWPYLLLFQKKPNHLTPTTASLQLQGGSSSLASSEKFSASDRRCCNTPNLLWVILPWLSQFFPPLPLFVVECLPLGPKMAVFSPRGSASCHIWVSPIEIEWKHILCWSVNL